MLMKASEYVQILLKKAEEIEWETKDFQRADSLRKIATEIIESGEEWIPMF